MPGNDKRGDRPLWWKALDRVPVSGATYWNLMRIYNESHSRNMELDARIRELEAQLKGCQCDGDAEPEPAPA